MKPFYKSRKFGYVIADAITGLIALWAAVIVGEEWSPFVITTWGLFQPILLLAVWGIAKEDAAALAAGTHPSQRDQ